MASPLVTVICLCYNHERFVEAAVESVVKQTYPSVQIIVWDDASTDGSAAVIRNLQLKYPQIEVTLSEKNEGNCRAFNRAYALAKGEFIIDFATDDVMHERRVEKQIEFFNTADDRTGVVFTDATYIDDGGNFIRHHYEYLFKHKLIRDIPTGDVFRSVLTTYYIASPTMMMRRCVLDELGGYDEQLSYEDFDLWVRSSRIFRYGFVNERLCFIRLVSDSLSAGQYRKRSIHLRSTYLVCLKALEVCRDSDDVEAVVQRTRYELRQATLSDNPAVALMFWKVLHDKKRNRFADNFWKVIGQLHIPLSGARQLYLRLRYG